MPGVKQSFADKRVPKCNLETRGKNLEFHFHFRFSCLDPILLILLIVSKIVQRRNASWRPPSTVMTCPVVLLSRLVSRRKIASAWSAGVIGLLVSVRSA